MQAVVDHTQVGRNRTGGEYEREIRAQQRTAGQSGTNPPGRNQSKQGRHKLCPERHQQQGGYENQRFRGVEDGAEIERRAGMDKEDRHEEPVAERVQFAAQRGSVPRRHDGHRQSGDECSQNHFSAGDLRQSDEDDQQRQ